MSKVVGELRTAHSETEVEWAINKFSSLPQEVDTFHYSRDFHFIGENWSLQIYPNGQSKCNSKGWIALFVHRGAKTPPVIVSSTFGLKTSSGKRERKHDFTAEFTDVNSGWGTSHFQARSELILRKAEWMPSDVLTVTCSLRHFDPKSNSIKRIQELSQDMKRMLDGNGTDVTIRVKGVEFRSHRKILMARTPVFESMFRHEMVERETGIVTIEDCEPDVFRDFLAYLYTGRVDSLSPNVMLGLYELAEKYQVPALKTDCLDIVQKSVLSVDTFCEVIAVALKHDDKKMILPAIELLSKKMKDILVTKKWQVFLRKTPMQANNLLVEALNFKEGDKKNIS